MEEDWQADGLLASDGDAAMFVNTSVHAAHPGCPRAPGPPEPRQLPGRQCCATAAQPPLDRSHRSRAEERVTVRCFWQ
jgi:hypothetical protein